MYYAIVVVWRFKLDKSSFTKNMVAYFLIKSYFVNFLICFLYFYIVNQWTSKFFKIYLTLKVEIVEIDIPNSVGYTLSFKFAHFCICLAISGQICIDFSLKIFVIF